MTGMYGPAKMREGERICNLSLFVVQREQRLHEIARYCTETEHLEVYDDVLDSTVWPGDDPTHMPARDTAAFRRMYTCAVCG